MYATSKQLNEYNLFEEELDNKKQEKNNSESNN